MVLPTSNSLQTHLFKLFADRQSLESQIKSFNEILEQNGNIGMREPLVDAEGFPRNDINVYQVRQARQQIICLQNDYRALMNKIEKLIHELHANTKPESSQHLHNQVEGINLNENSSNDTDEKAGLKPILAVHKVLAGSPAEQAGLRHNDKILEFGSANADNFENEYATICDIVRNMRGRLIPIKILRNNEILDLVLKPQTWCGGGLLGCNIVVLNK